MEMVKTIHVAFVALSFAGFFIRGIWMLRDSTLLRQRWVRITPQVVDTVLLVSAIVLAVQLHYSPMEQPWLMAKIIALVVYIAVGQDLEHGEGDGHLWCVDPTGRDERRRRV